MSAGTRESEGSVMNTKKVLSAQRWLIGSVLHSRTHRGRNKPTPESWLCYNIQILITTYIQHIHIHTHTHVYINNYKQKIISTSWEMQGLH